MLNLRIFFKISKYKYIKKRCKIVNMSPKNNTGLIPNLLFIVINNSPNRPLLTKPPE